MPRRRWSASSPRSPRPSSNRRENVLAKTFRYIIAQRLIPRTAGGDRVAVVEILKSNSQTRDIVERGERPGHTLLDAIKASENEGTTSFCSSG